MAKPAFARLNLEDPGPDLDPWGGVAESVRDELDSRGELTDDERALRSQTFHDWAMQVPESRSGTLALDRLPYQREWYGERAAFDREQVVKKANQIGASTQSVRLGMFHADRGAVVIYVFPTLDLLKKFSRQRVKPAILHSDYLATRMSREHVDTVEQKQIGWGWWYGFGAEAPVEATDADMLIVDEYDFCDPSNVEQTERRVTGPMSAGLIRRLGIPTLPNMGISRLYDTTDMRAWTVKCPCSEWNRLAGLDAWKNNVDQKRAELICRKCRKPLDVREGEWVSVYPDRDLRGYDVPKLVIPGLNLATLIANSRKPGSYARQAFMNRDLGIAFAPEEGMLSIEALHACQRPELRLFEGMPPAGTLRTMSVDVADVRALNVVIRESVNEKQNRLVYIGLVEDEPGGRSAFETCCFLMEAFQINMATIDNLPDGRFSQAFCRRFPGRAYAVSFFTPGPGQRKEPPVWHVDDDEMKVSVWKARAIDATLDEFRLQHNLIPSLDIMPEDYVAQMRAPVAQIEETPSGAQRRRYVSAGADDWAMAEVYNLTAIELYWRNAGHGLLRGQGPTPLATDQDFTRSHAADYEREPEYRPGPDDAFVPEDLGLGSPLSEDDEGGYE